MMNRNERMSKLNEAGVDTTKYFNTDVLVSSITNLKQK